jgi:uncharacterized protein (TIGR02246 family)
MTSTEHTADTAAVRDILQRVYVAWAAGDADAFAALYRDDATVILPGMFHHGRSALHAYIAGAFAGPLKGSRGVDDPQDIRILGGNTAIVVSKAGIVMAGEQDLPTQREVLATWVLTKQDGNWQIAAYTNTPAH